MLVATVAPFVAAALQSTSLIRRLEDQVDTLADRERVLAALSEKLIQVQEEERRSIARDLHDDPLQRAILLTREIQNGPANPRIDRWRRELEEIIISLRATCTGLRPVVLDDLGLVGGLEWLTTNLGARSDLVVSLVVDVPGGGRLGDYNQALKLPFTALPRKRSITTSSTPRQPT